MVVWGCVEGSVGVLKSHKKTVVLMIFVSAIIEMVRRTYIFPICILISYKTYCISGLNQHHSSVFDYSVTGTTAEKSFAFRTIY